MSAAQNQPAAIERRPAEAIVGTFHEPDAITRRLRAAADRCHLISPMSSVGTLPPGHEVAISTVIIDVANETYPQSGKQALLKVALDKIAAAVGVSWSPMLSGGALLEKNLYEYRAIGIVKDFDGTERTIMGSRVMDLRDGSEAIRGMSDREIAMQRKFIDTHAESKAKNRALRSLGIRQTYSKEELEKPFAVARLMFTGRTEDPVMREVFARMIAEKALGASSLLFGAPAAAIPAGAVPARLAARTPDDFDDEDERMPPAATPAPIQATRPTPREQKPATIPGANRGDPRRLVTEAETRDLTYWLTRMEKDFEDGRVDDRYRDENERTCNAIRAELGKRRGDPPDDDRDPFADETLTEHR